MSTLRFSLLALGLAWLAGAPPSASRRQGPPAATLRIDSRLVTLEVLVLDRRTGAHVEGLGREDFEVYDDGHSPDRQSPVRREGTCAYAPVS
ncbi:MAG TPA: hypothetical protein VFC61_11110 [Blastocatellia bacterium]|nr:hypothetical protein [Blastocatellia bacterium]